MKKLLISILIVLIVALTAMTIFKGLTVFGLEIPGVSQIQEKDNQLRTSIEEATILASSDYKNVLDDMQTNIKKLEEEKKNYDDLVKISNGNKTQVSNQYQKYEIEYLWTIIGNHATSEGVVLKMDLVSGVGEKNYNLNFTVTGNYIGIIDFISSIENDSVLGFKIENFSMVPGASSEDLQATFTCKDITITDIKEGTSTKSDKSENTEQNSSNTTNKTNTTTENTVNANTTNTTSTTNTTNTANTTSTTNTTTSANTENVTKVNN